MFKVGDKVRHVELRFETVIEEITVCHRPDCDEWITPVRTPDMGVVWEYHLTGFELIEKGNQTI